MVVPFSQQLNDQNGLYCCVSRSHSRTACVPHIVLTGFAGGIALLGAASAATDGGQVEEPLALLDLKSRLEGELACVTTTLS